MKTFKQKFISLLALVFTTSFITDAQEIGEIFQGGYLFYIDETGENGLVAALEDVTEGSNMGLWGIDEGFEWGCFEQNVSGAEGKAIGSGYQNTLDILAQDCQTQNEGITAAQAAFNYSSLGYTGWFLPSDDELFEMYQTIGPGGSEGNIGGFETDLTATVYNDRYWSSSEKSSDKSWDIYFTNGASNDQGKATSIRVRPIRSVTFGEAENTEDDTADSFLDLPEGWSMFGYTCLDSVDAMVGFSSISDKIEIVKDEWGLAYLPSWDFNAMGSLHFSEGYQIKMIEEVTNYQFCEPEYVYIFQTCDMYDNHYSSSSSSNGWFRQSSIECGCTYEWADNYNPSANAEDGSCLFPGCTYNWADNYSPFATVNDGSCFLNGISQADLDAAFDEGVASVTECGILNGLSINLGCGCGNPQAQTGYDCDGNEIVLAIGDWHEGGYIFQINEDGTGLVYNDSFYGVHPYFWAWNDAMDTAESATSEGYDDWYLPNASELQLTAIGGFPGPHNFWSSSEYDSNHAWGVDPNDGNSYYSDKDNNGMVRIIRAF
jgi:hypothetical protein